MSLSINIIIMINYIYTNNFIIRYHYRYNKYNKYTNSIISMDNNEINIKNPFCLIIMKIY